MQPGSLIAGFQPSSVGSGNFSTGPSAGYSILTDGQLGNYGEQYNDNLAAGGSSAGTSLTYTLTGPANGYNLSSIVVYGGWSDDGRDEQSYTISYSTVAASNTFITLDALSHTAALTGGDPNATRLTFTSSTGSPLATGVAKVEFNFASPGGQENGWQGYSQISLYGTAAPPTLNAPAVSGGNLILTGSGGTPGENYTWLTSTNLAAPLSTWTTAGTGVFGNNGAFSNAIPIISSQPAGFFVLEIP